MSKLRVNAFTVSADGFGAGPDQGQDQPLGRGGEQLHQWFLPTRTFQRNVLSRDGGTSGIDNDFAQRSFENLGAWIMGRNTFGPVRGRWPDLRSAAEATRRRALDSRSQGGSATPSFVGRSKNGGRVLRVWG